jgi:RHH-type transcriptional regulator, proline utilization regulon repressor / proline dehydrogenase / delta 1-pyrroline-5-carboxylate dehydrogenase
MPVSSATEYAIEEKVMERGYRLLAEAQRRARSWRDLHHWRDRFLDRLMQDERFRVQALRFVDVLPMLEDDRALVRHLYDYFGEEGFPLTGLIKFGARHIHGKRTNALIARAVRKGVEMLARRFMGGANAREALTSARRLYDRGIGFSLDLFGEACVSETEAERYQQSYAQILNDLPAQLANWPPLRNRRNGWPERRLNLSLKLSSLYSQINPLDPEGSIEGIAGRLRPLLAIARKRNAFVCIDMEHYELQGITLAGFKRLLMEPEWRDWPDVGLALQAYLKQTETDLQGLIEWVKTRGTPITVRLVRGAYWDRETVIARLRCWPMPVWESKTQTDICYERCIRLLFEHHPHIKAAFGTHNVRSIALAMILAEEYGLAKDQFELQMLYGMAPSLEDLIPELGYLLRIYVPFGELLPGMAYLVRRLLENSSSQSFQRMSVSQRSAPDELLASPALKPQDSPSPTSSSEGRASTPEFANEPLHRFTDQAERSRFQEAIEHARGNLGVVYPLLIDGKGIDTGDYLISVNPARPEQIVGRVARASQAQADQAVAGALRAFAAWAALSMAERAEFLFRAAALLRSRRDGFAAFEIFEAGKTWSEADANVAEAIDYLEYYGRQAMHLGRPRAKNMPGETNLHLYRPRGVGLIVPPWNFPLAITTGMLSAALVTGNTVILKPSSQTPVIAARFVALLQEEGLPPGVVQFLPGAGSTIGEYLVQHPKLHVIAFTGSEEIGTRIMRLAAEIQAGQQHVKHVVAEMGGKNAIIVDSDADLDEAVVGIVQSAFGYQGQKCSACSRVIVVGRHYDRFLERLIEATRSLRIGLPEQPGILLGPVIEEAAKCRILAAIEAGKQEAKLVLQIDCSDLGDGFFVGPAIFSEVPQDSSLAQKEIFGPVLSVLRAQDIEEALMLANHSRYALTGGLYSRSPGNIEKVKRAFQVGNLYINRSITGALVERQPFGGFKLSGLGNQAGGPDYLLHFLIPRTITENTLRRGFAPVEEQ